jgi:predicted nucleotidyltransferase
MGRLEDYLQTDSRVRFAYLFGSRAQGTFRQDSDLDVALWLDVPYEELGNAVLDLTVRLSSLIGVEADVVDLNRSPILLRNQILRTGRLLLDRDRTSRIEFESRTIQEAIDFETVRRRCAAGMVRKIQEEARLGS